MGAAKPWVVAQPVAGLLAPLTCEPAPAFRDRGNQVVRRVQSADGQWRVRWDIAASELPPSAPPETGPLPG